MGMYGLFPKVVNAKGELVEQEARPQMIAKPDEGRTVQADRNEADINKILARFEKSGMITHLSKETPFYGDVSEFSGLQDCLIKVREADELFMGMSATIRERFENNPVKMVDFLADERNREEAISLGMVLPPPVTPEDSQAGLPSAPPPTPPAPAGGVI